MHKTTENIVPFSGTDNVSYLSYSEKSKNYADYNGLRKKKSKDHQGNFLGGVGIL